MRSMVAIVVLSAAAALGIAAPAQAASQPRWRVCWSSSTVGVALGYTVVETSTTCWTRHGYRTHVRHTFTANQ